MEQQNEHISEQHRPETLTNTKAKPLGEVKVPAIMCGAAGAVLSIILSVIGWYDGVNSNLKAYYMGEPFYMPEPSVTSWGMTLDAMLVMLLTFGVSFAVLDTDKQWRRVMLLFLFTVVVILSSPVLMLWNVYWSPMTVGVGLVWSWMCAFIYSCQHTMPCEILLETKEQQETQIDQEEERLIEELDTSDSIESEQSPLEKYQPKGESSCPD